MAAGFALYKMSGANKSSASFSTETNLGSKDDLTSLSTQMSISVPETGTAYSYELWVKPKCSRAPFNNAYNFCIWYRGDNPSTGCKLYGGSSLSYSAPSSTKSTKATHDMIEYTSIGDSMPCGGHVNAIGSSFPYIILQIACTSQAQSIYGNQTPMIIHYSYSED